MSWTWDATKVADGTATGNLMYVRFLIGDTDTNDQQVDDATINNLLTLLVDVYQVSMQCVLALIGYYSRRVSISVDGLRLDMQQRVDHYKALYAQIKKASDSQPGTMGAPVVSGISLADMTSVATNSDRPPSREVVGMMDAPGILPPINYQSVNWALYGIR